MAGTKAGAIKASATNRERYGQDFYRRIGQIGGRNGHTGGFASNPELARVAGRGEARLAAAAQPALSLEARTSPARTYAGASTKQKLIQREEDKMEEAKQAIKVNGKTIEGEEV